MKKIFVLALLSAVYVSINAQGTFKDPRDGNVYKTVTIQGMVWMAENLRYKAPGGAYYFDNNPNTIQQYGMLYDWKTAMKACPDGWRLPTGDEFRALITNNEVKEAMKARPNESNAYSIQLAGMQDHEGNLTEIDESGYYWTSTEYDENNAEYFSYLTVFNTPVADISRKEDIEDVHGTEKTNKYSVRCVKIQK